MQNIFWDKTPRFFRTMSVIFDLHFILYMNWRKKWRGLNWDELSLEPLLKPGTGPKYSAVQGGAIRGVSSYGSLSQSLQWKLCPSVLHSFPFAVPQDWQRSFCAAWDQSWVGEGVANWWLSVGCCQQTCCQKTRHHPCWRSCGIYVESSAGKQTVLMHPWALLPVWEALTVCEIYKQE